MFFKKTLVTADAIFAAFEKDFLIEKNNRTNVD